MTPLSNAPVSWGVYHADTAPVTADAYLDEVAASGYAGTELGPYGFLPIDPAALADALAARGLALVGAVHVHDFVGGGDAALFAALDRLAPLLAANGCRVLTLMDGGTGWRPEGPSPQTEAALAASLEVGRNRVEALGLRLAFHPHVLTAVETEAQIDRLLDASGVALCLDTGHHAFWGADPADYLDRRRDRIAAIHLKNVDPTLRDAVAFGGLDASEAMRRGAFCPLDAGAVDIPAFLNRLGPFDGPVVIEQDWTPASEPPVHLARRNAAFLGRASGA